MLHEVIQDQRICSATNFVFQTAVQYFPLANIELLC